MAKRGRSSKNLSKSSRSQVKKSSYSYASLLYGAITVIVLCIVAFLGVSVMRKTGTVGEPGVQTFRIAENKTYVVQEGDSLWTISQKIYNDGYQWTKLAVVNNIMNPDEIEQGTKIVVPNVPLTITPRPVVSPTPEPQTLMQNVPPQEKIVENSYTVVRGDNLWTIAVRAYGDGYKWVEIAQANHLANPDLIHAGNKFILPR